MELITEFQVVNNKINEIAQFLKSKGLKKKSIKSYCSVLKKVFSKLGTEFTEKDVEYFLTWSNLHPRSYNNYRTIINFYTKQYLNYSLSFTKAKVDKTLPTYVTLEELKRVLLTIPNIKHKLAFALMYGSGLRVYEVCRLQKHNIYYDELVLRVIGKGGKERHTILPPRTAEVLKKFTEKTKPNNPYVFQTYRRHISERSLQVRLEKAIKDSGVTKHFTCHSLRHSFAVNFLNKTSDLERLRRLLGHSSITSTQIYAQCRIDDLTALAKEVYKSITPP